MKKPMDNSIYLDFINQVTKNSKNTALSYAGKKWTYQALSQSINKTAQFLLPRVTLGSKVALVFDPTPEYIITLFACLKLGVTFIPLNLYYPDNYLITILDSAEVNVVLHNNCKRAFLKNYCSIDITNSEKNEISITNEDPVVRYQNDEIYIIYTSGSTGEPKGVVITQAAILNLIQATRGLYNIGSEDRVPLFHSLGFDFSIWEIFSALFNGAMLVIPTEENKANLVVYADYLLDTKISIVNMTPSAFYEFSRYLTEKSEEKMNASPLRLIILGGEAFYPNRIKSWFKLNLAKRAKIYNMYGITEGTIHSTYQEITEALCRDFQSLIGEPLAGVDISVIDDNDIPVLTNMVGELCLAGVSIAKEYLNNPILTNSKFMLADFGSGSKRWFKTGDLVKRLDNNKVEYIGRKDCVIKIRGFRINLQEVEHKILQCPHVENVLVTSHQIGENNPRLVAYLKNKRKLIDLADIKATLNRQLPQFMHPQQYIIVDEFPYTKNGKMDLELLCKQSSNQFGNHIDENESVRERIKSAWKSVLQCDDVDEKENFFEAGGDSLLLLKLRFMLQEYLGQSIAIMDLIQYPNITRFAEYIENKGLVLK